MFVGQKKLGFESPKNSNINKGVVLSGNQDQKKVASKIRQCHGNIEKLRNKVHFCLIPFSLKKRAMTPIAR